MAEIIDVLLQLKDNFSSGLNTAMGSLDKFSNNVNKVTSGFTGMSLAAGGALAFAGKAAADFQRASDSTARGLDLAGKELEAFKKQAQDLTEKLNFQKSTTEVLNLATSVGKLGISKDQIMDYSEAIVQVATATDKLNKLDEMGTNLAKIGTIFEFSAKDVKTYGAALNRLDDDSAATADNLLDFTKRVGGIGKVSKIAATDLTAFGATLISSGQTSEVASTFTNKLFSVLGAAGNTSKGAQAAIQKLGFDVKQLSIDFDRQAIPTTLKFLESIQKLDSVTQKEILGEIFGAEHSDSAALLLGQLDNLRKYINAANDSAGNANKLGREFDQMSKSLDGQMNALKNQMNALGVSIGSAVLPGFLDLTSAITPMAAKLAELVQQYPMLSTMIAGALAITAIIAPLGMIISSITALMGSIGALNAMLVPFFAYLTGNIIPGLVSIGAAIIPGIIASIGSLLTAVGGIVIAFAPWIAAIAAVAAGAYLIITNWDKVKAFFAGWITFVKTDFQNLWIAIDTGMKNFLGKSAADWERLKTNVSAIWEGLGTLIKTKITEWDTAWVNFLAGLNQKTVAGLGSVKASWNSYTNFIKQDMQSLDAAWFGVLQKIKTNLQPALNGMRSQWQNYINFIKQDFQNLVNYVMSLVGQFRDAGSKLIGGFVEGFKSRVSEAVNAAANLTGEMAKYLPHSDAEKGALSRLFDSGRSFVNTFMSGIKSTGFDSMLNSVLPIPKGNTGTAPLMPRAQGGGGITINLTYSPQISGSKEDAESILRMLRNRDRELMDILNNAQSRFNRSFYSI